MAAMYTKLKDGSWGIRVTGQTVAAGARVTGQTVAAGARVTGQTVAAGARVTVTKKSGETKVETVGRVLWTGAGVILCSVVASAAPARRAYAGGRAGGMYCGYPCPVTGRKCCAANGPCHDCE